MTWDEFRDGIKAEVEMDGDTLVVHVQESPLKHPADLSKYELVEVVDYVRDAKTMADVKVTLRDFGVSGR